MLHTRKSPQNLLFAVTDCKTPPLFYGKVMLQRQIGSILAISGLFFQLLIFGLHMPGSIVLAGFTGVPISAKSAYRVITICTKSGLRQIVIGENNQPLERDVPIDTGGIACPACQCHASQLLLVEGFSLPAQVKTPTILSRFSNTGLENSFHRLRSFARAPPIA